MLRRWPGGILVAVSTVAVSACGGGSDDDGGTSPTPSFELSVSPTTLPIQAGGSGTLTVAVTRVAFNDAIGVTLENLPTGVTAAPVSIAAGGSTATLTVSVAAIAGAGASTLTVRASGTGVTARSADVQLVITAALTPSIGLTIAPNALSIAQGLSGNANLTITRSNFTGAVSVSAGGGPAGMTFSFTPTSVTGTTSAMTVAVGTAVVPGIYTITVQGTGVNVPNATATLTVTVTGPPASIALSAVPQTLTIQQGQSGTSQLTIARTNFTGTVNLTSSGAPAGITVTLSPSSTTGTSVAVTVAVSATLVAGNYSVTIQAGGTGIANVSLTLPVSVTAAGGTGNVTFTFCAQSGLPLWFAFSDNGSAFTRIPGTSGVFNFTVGQRGRVAWVMQDGSKTRLELFYGSLQDLNARGRSFCRGNGSSKTINARISGVTAGQRADVSLGTAFASTLLPSPTTVQLTNVQDGLLDLIGVRQPTTLPAITNAFVILRDRNEAHGATIAVDFNSGVATVSRAATIANLGADVASLTGGFLSKNGTLANLFLDPGGTAVTRSWASLPDASAIAGDWHMLTAMAIPSTSTDGFPFRAYQLFARFGGDRTLTLPDHIMTQPTFVVSSTVPYVTFGSQWLIQSPQYNDFWSLTLTPASGSVSAVVVSGTAGYFGGGPARLDLPAFDASFNAQHGLQPGIQLSCTFFAAGGTAWGNTIGHAPLPNEGEFGTTAGIRGTPFTP
ncbi:MAG: COG1470 family protein [Gemmatimonadaceae bacterium]